MFLKKFFYKNECKYVWFQTLTPVQQEETEEKIILLTDKISNLIDEAEEAGCQGNVEKAQGLLKFIDQLKDEKEELKQRLDGTVIPQVRSGPLVKFGK